MADVTEDFASEVDIYLDSGNDSDEELSEYENQLYSLVHYSEDSVLKDGDSASVYDTYISRGSKVSRLNPVRDIIDSADTASRCEDRYRGETSKTPASDSELRVLLNSYRNASSHLSHSTPLSKDCHWKTSVSALEEQFDSRRRNKDISVSDCFNAKDSFPFDEQSDYILIANTTEPNLKNKNLENHSEGRAGTSRRYETNSKNDETYKGNSNQNSRSIPELNRKENSEIEISVDEEIIYSKYNMELNASKKSAVKDDKNASSDSIIVIDDSDSDTSILEVEVPVKEPPPVVNLSSENEEETAACKDDDDDIVVVYSGSETPATTNLNGETPVVKKKSKKKKKKKKSMRYPCFSNSEISPSSWTDDMSRFYNDSWGGEEFDVKKLQSFMSGKQSKWRVLPSDTNNNYNRKSIRCQKCNHYGHVARHCTEIQKPIVCHFCGIMGHIQRECPSAMCLRCGKPSMGYDSRCQKCSSMTSHSCNACGIPGHYAADCPERWRKYHSTCNSTFMPRTFEPRASLLSGCQQTKTNDEAAVAESQTLYKPNNQQHCSNCAGIGHQFHECNKSTQQGNWQKRANTSFTPPPVPMKRRKLPYRNGQYFNNRRAKLSPFLADAFTPFYERYM